jgi:hypothetical protein
MFLLFYSAQQTSLETRGVPLLFSVALVFPFHLQKVKSDHLPLTRLTNIAIWSFYILGRGLAGGDAARVASYAARIASIRHCH